MNLKFIMNLKFYNKYLLQVNYISIIKLQL